MARKHELISEIYNRICKTVISVCQNYKLCIAEPLRLDRYRKSEEKVQYPEWLQRQEYCQTEVEYRTQEKPTNNHLKIESSPIKEKTNPNTTPIGNDDYYFHRSDVCEFEAVYYNPDATAGGQFVFAHLPYDLIIEAKANTDSANGFFEYLDERAKTELIDLGTPEYDAILGGYADPHPECIGRSTGTMNILVSRAESELEKSLSAFNMHETQEEKILCMAFGRLNMDNIRFEAGSGNMAAEDVIENSIKTEANKCAKKQQKRAARESR